MKINEIFYSIQGEGVYAGVPTAFIRLQGCNLRCSYCDTKYAQDLTAGGKHMSAREIVSEVIRVAPEAGWVCITGGEPLLQAQEVRLLVEGLHKMDYKAEIETNGSYPRPVEWDVDSWVPDIKCPCSGVASAMRYNEQWLYGPNDQVKFVVATEEDLSYVEGILLAYPNRTSTILISPVINLIKTSPLGREDYFTSGAWFQRCVEFCKKHDVRFSLQIHKFVWPPGQRGV